MSADDRLPADFMGLLQTIDFMIDQGDRARAALSLERATSMVGGFAAGYQSGQARKLLDIRQRRFERISESQWESLRAAVEARAAAKQAKAASQQAKAKQQSEKAAQRKRGGTPPGKGQVHCAACRAVVSVAQVTYTDGRARCAACRATQDALSAAGAGTCSRCGTTFPLSPGSRRRLCDRCRGRSVEAFERGRAVLGGSPGLGKRR